MTDDSKAEVTPLQMRQKIEEAPMPNAGEPIHKRDWGDLEMGGYGPAAESLARALLITAEEHPELMDVSKEEAEDDRGFAAAENDKLWEATKERFPGLNEWLGGITGFQYGWAHNAVRHILGEDPVGNPAIISVGEGGDADAN